MPYINIKITREGTTAEQKAELIKGATELLARVLNKNPKTTVVTIEEVDTDSWGIGGDPAEIAREKGEAQDAKIARLEADKEEQEKEFALKFIFHYTLSKRSQKTSAYRHQYPLTSGICLLSFLF